MYRLTAVVAAAVFMAGCSEAPVAPNRALEASAAARDVGNPPPPPVASSGLADFEAFLSDGSEATTCSASESFNFAYEYFINKPGNNAFLHMRVDGQGLDVSIHQTNKKVDAKGTITGPGFSFDIGNVVEGGIINGEQHVPSSVFLQLTGKLTTENGTCNVNATLSARLVPTEVIP